MPGKDGKLTDADYKHVQDWMAKFPGAHACPICTQTQWNIGQHLVQPVTLGENSSIQFGGVGYPNVLLISPCGYSRLMNAVIMGLIPNSVGPLDLKKD